MGNTNVYFCDKHSYNMLRFYCQVCDELICRDCKLTRHEGHQTTDISDAVEQAKKDLSDKLEKLGKHMGELESALRKLKEKQSTITQGRVNVLNSLIDRKILLTKWVEDIYTFERYALNAVENGLNLPLKQSVSSIKTKLQTVNEFENEITGVLKQNEHKPILVLRNTMRAGEGSDEHLQQLVSDLPVIVDRSVVLTNENDPMQPCLALVSEDQPVPMTLRDAIAKFLPRLMLRSAPVEVNVSKVFGVNGDSQVAEVYAVCPTEGGKVWVAVQSNTPGSTSWVGLYSSEGTLESRKEVQGRVSIARAGENSVVVAGQDFGLALMKQEEVTYFNLGKNPFVLNKLEAHFAIRADNHLVDQLFLSVDEKEGQVHLVTDVRRLKANKPIAADASRCERFVALIEDSSCNVLLFYRSVWKSLDALRPYACYNSPSLFKPTDVCFYWMGGLERLMVASSIGHAIHVLEFRETCELLQTIGHEFPLLKSPTALTADRKGRLWIGCQNGDILLLQPQEQETVL